MAAGATGVRVVFFGSHKQPSYVVETCAIPKKEELQDGEILIKILLATICPLDIDHIDGNREVKTPCVLGHEGVGEVVISRRIINGAPAVGPGDRVSFTMANKCGCCCMCKAEMQECCCASVKYGCSELRDGRGLNGCYATHMVLKKGTQVVRVPNNVTNAAASPANCALATMVHAVSVLTSTSGLKHSVAVIQGANLMGLYGCALLHEAGFQQVFCHDVSSERLRLVPKFSGIPVLVENEYDYSTSHQPECGAAEVVIDVCGGWDVVPYGLNALSHRGIYVFVGNSHEEHVSLLTVDTIIKKCVTVKGIQGYKATHLEKAIDFLSLTANKYPYESLVSSPLPLQEFHAAVRIARSKRYYRTAVKPTTILAV